MGESSGTQSHSQHAINDSGQKNSRDAQCEINRARKVDRKFSIEITKKATSTIAKRVFREFASDVGRIDIAR